ncbi:sensor histidine kinase [Nonomuraea typhae]|uniref:sensor histidine kinase n=1 Tax=Nonomuraea typhae TaxID=2603600 RepID=UPI0012F74BF9|nr:histidine kinase [Nonomuraea typhae]
MGVIWGVRLPTVPGTEHPEFRLRPFVLLAAASLVMNALIFQFAYALGVLSVPVSALVSAPVLVAWYRPVAGWVLAFATVPAPTLAGLAMGSPDPPVPWMLNQELYVLPVLYLFALSVPLGVSAAGYVMTIAAGVATAVPVAISPQVKTTGVLVWSLTLLVAVVLGHNRRVRRLATMRVADELSKRKLVEERTRIARELHDVVAHHMSVIAVQAASAPYRVDDVSEAAAEEFAAINAAARASLNDMRRLLGALRGADEPPDTAPQPGVEDLESLVDSVRQAGLPVRLVRTGEHPIGPVRSVTVYRMVQEALSNVVRHAPGAAVTVTVRAGADAVEVEVENAPAPAGTPAPGLDGSGVGLAGMRERVTALGGHLETGPTSRGGFAVRGRLPEGERA